MPKLPDYTALGPTHQPEPSQRVPEYSAKGFVYTGTQAGEYFGRALQQVGHGLEQLGVRQQQEEKKADALQSAQADADVTIGLAKVNSELSKDPNYENWPKKYDEATGQLIGQAQQRFSDPAHAEAFRIKQNQRIALGSINVQDEVFRRRGQAVLAENKTKDDELYQSALNDPDPASADAKIKEITALHAGAVQAGYAGAKETDAYLRKRSQQFGEDWWKLQTEERRLELMQQRMPGAAPSSRLTPEQQQSALRTVNAARPSPEWGDPRQPGFEAEHLTTIATPSGKEIRVNTFAAKAFQGFLGDLEASGYKIDDISGANFRNKRGTNQLSQHAYGNAIDINPDRNPHQQEFKTDLPPNVGEMAAKWGLSWGGNWSGKKDTMHFEYTGFGAGGAQTQTAAAQPLEAPQRSPSDPAAIRYNNPGAQWPAAESPNYGMTGVGIIGGGNNIAQFPTPEQGAAANMDLLSRRYVGMTIGDAAKKWSNSGYSGVKGFDPNTVITKEMVRDPEFAVPFFKAISQVEAGKPYPMSDAQWQTAHQIFLAGGTSAPAEAARRTGTPADYIPGHRLPTLLRSAERDVVAKQRRINSEDSAAKYELQGRLDDAVGAVGAGAPEPTIDYEQVAARLGPKAAIEYQDKIAVAHATHQASSDFSTTPGGQIQMRVDALRPDIAKPDYNQQEQIYEAVKKRAKAAMDLRDDDPAGSVRDDPAVHRATLAVQGAPGDPGAKQRLYAARIDAQQRAGIVDPSPITKGESADYIANLRQAVARDAVEPPKRGQESSLVVAQKKMAEDMRAQFGPYADKAMVGLLGHLGRDRAMSDAAADIMKDLMAGQAPTPTQVQVLKETKEADQASRSMLGTIWRGAESWRGEPGPAAPAAGARSIANAAEVPGKQGGTTGPMSGYQAQQYLLAHPETAAKYDQTFPGGPPAAAVLSRRQGASSVAAPFAPEAQ